MYFVLFPLLAMGGLLFDIRALFYIGAAFCLLVDINGLVSGRLKLGIGSLIFYVIGYFVANGDWVLTALYGALLGVSVEAIIFLVMMAIETASKPEEVPKSNLSEDEHN